jgi:hypothetical protein
MIKRIYILWFQDFINAPDVIKKCLKSWIHYNPSWEIIQLNRSNIHEYIDLKHYLVDFFDKKIMQIPALSDIIRIKLLKKYGGLWVDATTYCNRSLDEWLPNMINEGFFAFDKPGADRMISSWFIYASEDNYIVDLCHKKTVEFWEKKYIDTVKTYEYFWFHYLFGDCYNIDTQFKQFWDKVPKKSADLPHYILSVGMFCKINKKIKKNIDSKKTPLYKLTYRGDFTQYNKRTVLYYLYKANGNTSLHKN